MTFSVGLAGTALLLTASAAFLLEPQAHALPGSEPGHANCKTGRPLKTTQSRHLDTSVSSMTYELLHAAYQPMAHYLLVLRMTPVP
jgi:hypothetical protein